MAEDYKFMTIFNIVAYLDENYDGPSIFDVEEGRVLGNDIYDNTPISAEDFDQEFVDLIECWFFYEENDKSLDLGWSAKFQ